MGKLLYKEVPERLNVNVSHSMRVNDGIMAFGENNDYPDLLEKLIDGSATAVSASDMLAKFIAGQGFTADINNIVVGIDEKGKDITIQRLLRNCAESVSRNNGYYIKVIYQMSKVSEELTTPQPIITKLSHVPFKKNRFSVSDDENYSPFIYVYDDWPRLNGIFSAHEFKGNKKKKLNDPVQYNVFNTREEVLKAQMQEEGFKGQIFFHFFDDKYFYPLSPFDSVYLDLDTEREISEYDNNEVRNGFVKHTLIGLAPANSKEESEKQQEHWEDAVGARANKVTIYTKDANAQNEIDPNSAVTVNTIDSNIDPNLFEGLNERTKKKIQKAAKNIPSILIDQENGAKMGTTSGEAFQQAVNIYNAVTQQLREELGRSLSEILSKFNDPILQKNQDWSIAPLELQVFEKEVENGNN